MANARHKSLFAETDRCDKCAIFFNIWTADKQLFKDSFSYSDALPHMQAHADYTHTLFYATGNRLIPTSCLNA